MNDTTPVRLATEEEQIRRRQWQKELAIQARETERSAAREPQGATTMTKPIRVDPNVPKPRIREL